MLSRQSTHLKQIGLIPPFNKLIKFCYFIAVLTLMACGEEKKQQQDSVPEIADQSNSHQMATTKSKTILCFGDSITAGFGLEDNSEAYPAILQQKIDSLDLDYTVINSGLSGETTAGGNSRIDWVMQQKVDVFLLELGGNDGLRGIPLTETKSNLQDIIEKVKTKNPNIQIILAGMELPPNMGVDYTSEFRKVFADIAATNKVSFIPFILKNVGGIPELNLPDGIHPTAEGHKIVATTVWEVLLPLLN